MIWGLAIAAGVAIGARVLRCFFDELTDEEREKQADIEQRHLQLQIAYSQREHEISAWKKRELEAISEEEAAALSEQQAKHEAQLRKTRQAYCQMLLDEANSRLEDEKSLYTEIQETISTVRDTLKTQTSFLRRNTLLGLQRELDENKEKVHAYTVYLQKYIKKVERAMDSDTIIPPPFSFILPSEFFYKGKVFFLEKKDLLPRGKVSIPIVGDLNYSLNEDELTFVEDWDEKAMVPLMCAQFIAHPHYIWKLSARKGYFKNAVAGTPKVGITAVVKAYGRKRDILLNYNDCVELRLPVQSLENEKRYPPIGAELRVFPVHWTNDLKYPVLVSERVSDSYLSYTFEQLPLVFSRAQWEEFRGILEEKELLRSTGDWKIAPLDEMRISKVEEVKLQLDRDICLSARIVQREDKLYFSYNGVLSDEYFLRPEDVFLGVDCTLDVYLDSDLEQVSPEGWENMNSLTLLCLSEFKIQYQTKISRAGMQYFNKWAETTDKLITYLYKGKRTEVEVTSYEKLKEYTYTSYVLYVGDPEELKAFVDGVYENAKQARNVEFFFEISAGIYCFVFIKGDGSALYFSGEAAVLDPYLEGLEVLTIFQRDFPYAEIQQAIALQRFRTGRLTNALLQAYALDGTHICSSRQKLESLELCDSRIRGDISQYMTVEAALEEKDIFLIQGPPGTGKTTVIREIILQKLKEAPESKILVVSQANVAVDNVLQGILRAEGFLTGFIRCGREDKIGDTIKPYSFEEIYGTYVCRLKERLAEDPENLLLAKWDEIVSSEGKYNPNVGELILRGKPIIGATCVGLAQKRIGLDRVEYDLVIVDEAGKALPAEILIPYVRGKKVILIGDHMQLPPTVHPALLDPEKIEIEDRDVYEDDLFHTSFFEKLFNSAPETNKAMLTTQYRMPGVIGTMVSQLFYGGALKNGAGVEKKQPLFFDKNITLINMKGERFRENVPKGSSVTNPGEAELAVRLLRVIRQKISAAKAKVAVITPYKGQRRELLKVLEKRAPYLLFQGIEVNTVDAFQGDEAEIVVFCCTRTHTPTNFFKDPRRINVAFSRAKNELILLGSLDYFRKFGETSVLPAVAEYIRLHGKVLNPEEVPSCRPAGARDPGQAGNTPNLRKAASGNRKKSRPPED